MAKRRFGDDDKNLESSEEKSVAEDTPFTPEPAKTLESAKPTETKSAAPAEEKKPPAQSVPLRVFVNVSGRKPDQMAGFVYHAKKEKLGPRSVPEWRAEFEKFLARPVK